MKLISNIYLVSTHYLLAQNNIWLIFEGEPKINFEQNIKYKSKLTIDIW